MDARNFLNFLNEQMKTNVKPKLPRTKAQLAWMIGSASAVILLPVLFATGHLNWLVYNYIFWMVMGMVYLPQVFPPKHIIIDF